MPYVFLIAAIVLEVAGITAMKLSRGFSELLPSLAVPVFYALSAACVIVALKRLELATTYAIWSGDGYRARGRDWNRVFPRVHDPVQACISRSCDRGRGWLVLGGQAD